MKLSMIALSLMMLTAVGCKDAKPKKTDPNTPVTSAQPLPVTAKDAASGDAEARAEVIATDKLQSFVDQWLAAQNGGDFASYEAMYATKFTGTKRVGPRVTQFARKNWLADRQRMFKRAMKVEATELAFLSSPSGADVTFTQSWESGKFADRGPKRLMLVMEGDSLKIAQEEMLRSELVDATSASKGLGDFYFLLDGDLVIPAEGGTPEPKGDITLQTDGDQWMTAAAELDESELDDEQLALKGQSFRTDEGCVGTLTGFHMVSRLEPHFGTVQGWNCQYVDGDCEKASDEDRAAQIWESGERLLLGTIDGCASGSYAQPAARPDFPRGEVITDDKLRAQALKAFAKLEDVSSQGEGEDWPEEVAKEAKTWWKGIEVVQIFKHPVSGQILVSVMASTGNGCGDFTASGWQLWEARGGALLPIVFGSAPFAVEKGIDVDGDGVLELIGAGPGYGSQRELFDAKTLSSLRSLSYRYADCPC